MSSLPVNISIIDDDTFEGNESFILTIINSSSLPSRVSVKSDCMAIVTIVDDDGEFIPIIFYLVIATYIHTYIQYILYVHKCDWICNLYVYKA